VSSHDNFMCYRNSWLSRCAGGEEDIESHHSPYSFHFTLTRRLHVHTTRADTGPDLGFEGHQWKLVESTLDLDCDNGSAIRPFLHGDTHIG